MLILKYQLEVDVLECEPKVKDCCNMAKNPPADTGTGDCCYDNWVREKRELTVRSDQVIKTVNLLNDRVNYVKAQRDMWKGWYDELTQVNDYSRKICHQLEIILHHTARINKNTHLTLRAIHLLYCMVKDFYMQVDLLKMKYDSLVNCIKCLNNPALAPGQGILILIEDYGKKLDAVIQTRDALIEALIKAIYTINKINKSIGHHYGLHTVLDEWKKAFRCDEKCYSDDNENERRRNNMNRERYRNRPEGQIEDIGLEPSLHQPICNSGYYFNLWTKFEQDSQEVDRLSIELLRETKESDTLIAWLAGLESVIKDIDPKTRCITTGK